MRACRGRTGIRVDEKSPRPDWDQILSRRLSREGAPSPHSGPGGPSGAPDEATSGRRRDTVALPVPPTSGREEIRHAADSGRSAPPWPSRDSAALPRQRPLFVTEDARPEVGAARPSSPQLVVDELSRLTPRQEKRALDILAGKRSSGTAAAVIALAAVAAAAGAGAVLWRTGLFRREGVLELAGEVSPPEELAREPARGAKERRSAGACAEKPPDRPGRPGGTLAGRRPGPSDAEVPTFRLKLSGRREVYVEIGGPLIDLASARPGQ